MKNLWTDPLPITMYEETRAQLICTVIGLIISIFYWAFRAPAMVYGSSVVLMLVLAESVLFAFIHNMRHREEVAAWMSFSTHVALTALVCFNQSRYIQDNVPFTPFIGVKIIAVFLPLLCPPQRWVAWGSLIVMAVLPLTQYYMWPEATHAYLSVQEPWITVIFLICSGVIYELRIKIAKVRLQEKLNSERMRLVQKMAHLLLSAKHLMNTPLQTIETSLALRHAQNPHTDDIVEKVERSFNVIRRVTELLSFAEGYVHWEKVELPTAVDELGAQVQDILNKIENEVSATRPPGATAE